MKHVGFLKSISLKQVFLAIHLFNICHFLLLKCYTFSIIKRTPKTNNFFQLLGTHTLQAIDDNTYSIEMIILLNYLLN